VNRLVVLMPGVDHVGVTNLWERFFVYGGRALAVTGRLLIAMTGRL
jgi:hypothetical protein